MKYPTFARVSARFFELISYVFTVFGWLWLGMLLAPLLEGTQALELLLPNGITEVQPVTPHESTSPFLLIVAAFVTASILILCVVLLWRLPKNILKAGSTVTQTVSEAIVPIAVHKKPLSKKKRLLLTRRTIFLVRLLFIVLPFIGLALCPPIKDVSREVVWFAGAIMAFIAAASLLIEQTILHFYPPQTEKRKK